MPVKADSEGKITKNCVIMFYRHIRTQRTIIEKMVENKAYQKSHFEIQHYVHGFPVRKFRSKRRFLLRADFLQLFWKPCSKRAGKNGFKNQVLYYKIFLANFWTANVFYKAKGRGKHDSTKIRTFSFLPNMVDDRYCKPFMN